MKNLIGPAVFGNNFLFRDDILKKGIRYLNNGNSFIILGIRRTGKSSILKQIAFLIKERKKSTVCIELDCQTYTSVLDFYKGLYSEMPKTLKTRFIKTLKDSKQLPTKLIDYVTDFIDNVEISGTKVDFHDKIIAYSKPFEDIVATFFKNEKDVILLIDELPFFFENMKGNPKQIKEITQVLSNLKSWRNAGLAMGITGSLNLHQQLDHYGISRKVLAGLNSIILDQFSYDESKEMITILLENENLKWWTDDITNKILELLPDYVPYFLQYAFNEIVTYEGKTPKDVEEIYHNNIMPGLFKDFIYQFEERLGIFRGDTLNVAMRIMDEIAVKGTVTLDELQESIPKIFEYNILTQLIDYEFLKLKNIQEYTYTLKIIRDWWTDKRGLHKK